MTDYKLPVIKKGALLIAKSLGIALVGVIILVFIGRTISLKTREIIQKREEFTIFTKKYELIDQLKKGDDFAKQNQAKLDNALPSIDNLTVISDYINNAANKTANIATTRFDTSVKTNELGTSEVPFSINNVGTFQSLTDFLSVIEKAPYFIEIKTISISFGEGIAGQTSTNLTGVAYVKNINDED